MRIDLQTYLSYGQAAIDISCGVSAMVPRLEHQEVPEAKGLRDLLAGCQRQR